MKGDEQKCPPRQLRINLAKINASQRLFSIRITFSPALSLLTVSSIFHLSVSCQSHLYVGHLFSMLSSDSHPSPISHFFSNPPFSILSQVTAIWLMLKCFKTVKEVEAEGTIVHCFPKRKRPKTYFQSCHALLNATVRIKNLITKLNFFHLALQQWVILRVGHYRSFVF